MSRRRLEGKVCLITDGARGIGASSARLFALEGARVAVVDLKDDLGQAVVGEIEQTGCQAVYHHCDVTRQADVATMVRTVHSAFGRIDVLFNNAGTAIEGDVEKLSEADWDRTFAINVKSMFCAPSSSFRSCARRAAARSST